MPSDTPAAPAPLLLDAHRATARPGEPESIGEILPRVLADLDRRRRIPSPLEEALLDADVRERAPPMEDSDDER